MGRRREVSDQRLAVGRTVTRMGMRDPVFRRSLPLHPDGNRHVLVAAPAERMQSLFDRMGRIGLPLTVAVRFRNGGVATVNIKEVPAVPRHIHGDDVVIVHKNTTVKMMMDFVWHNGGSAMLHLGLPEAEQETDYELVASA